MHLIAREPIVYHYGFIQGLAPQYHHLWQFEGNTFSVSLCPADWWAFAKALVSASTPNTGLFALSRRDGMDAEFIVLDRLTRTTRNTIDVWGASLGLGSLSAPNLGALRIHFSCSSIMPDDARNALAQAWAETQPVDGIWFAEQIGANLPRTSRGGIFQHRLFAFDYNWVAPLPPGVGWPAARVPQYKIV